MAEHRVLLIDLDNCPLELGKLTVRAESFSRIVVCHGVTSRRVELTTVGQLADVARLGKLEFCAMRRSGKNAADFGLAFCAGRLVEAMPSDTQFWILSNDSDLDHVVDLLRSRGRTAQRVGGEQSSKSDLRVAVDRYKRERLEHPGGRPQTQSRLITSINRFLGTDRTVAGGDVVKEMVRRNMLTIEGSARIRYHLELEREPEPATQPVSAAVLPDFPPLVKPPAPRSEPPPTTKRRKPSAAEAREDLPLFAGMSD